MNTLAPCWMLVTTHRISFRLLDLAKGSLITGESVWRWFTVTLTETLTSDRWTEEFFWPNKRWLEKDKLRLFWWVLFLFMTSFNCVLRWVNEAVKFVLVWDKLEFRRCVVKFLLISWLFASLFGLLWHSQLAYISKLKLQGPSDYYLLPVQCGITR